MPQRLAPPPAAFLARASVAVLACACLAAIACAAFAAAAPAPPPSGIPVLVVTETPETRGINYVNGEAAAMALLDYFLSPRSILAPDFAVTQAGWQRDERPFAAIDRVRAVLLWDVPRAVRDQRGTDPYYADRDVITDDVAAHLAEFVRAGGGLVVAGGAMCYGSGHERLGSADYRTPNRRQYLGLAGSPLAEILPVEVPDAVTLAAFEDAGHKRPAVSVARPDAMIDGLDLAAWPFEAIHRVRAKEGAEVLVAATDGSPLIVRWAVGKGRVVCVLASPRGGVLVRGADRAASPVWPQEAVLWDRALRWALGLDFAGKDAEAALVAKYEAIIADAPPVPLALVTGAFPYGTHAVDAGLPRSLAPLAMKYFAGLGMNHIVSSGFAHVLPDAKDSRGPEAVAAYVSRTAQAAARHNLYVFVEPAPADGARLAGLDPKEWAQVTQPGGKFALHYGQPRPCPMSPAVLVHAAEQMQRWAAVLAGEPRVRGALCDDEYAWVMGYRTAYEGDPGLACYAPWAAERFKKATGLDVPTPVYREPGYVMPEGDPFLRWCEVMRQDPFAEYNAALVAAARKGRPDLLVSNYPGGFEGTADFAIEEVYLDCWKESELEAFERLDVRANFRADRPRRDFPITALIGVFRMPETKSAYPESVRLTAGASLAAGARGMILWNAMNLWAPWFQHPGRDALEAEAKRLGAYLERFGPMHLVLERPESDVWMLSGWFWVNTFDNLLLVPPAPGGGPDKERPWWHFQTSDVAGPAAMRAGLPVEFVTEKQLMSDALMDRKAVLLPGFIYAREAVVRNLERYAAAGGKVFLDQSARVKIEGATVLPVDLGRWHADIAAGKRPIAEPCEANYRKHRAMREAYIDEAARVMREAVTPAVGPRVRLEGAAGAVAWMTNGAARYLYVFNTNTDGPERFTVRCRDVPPVIIDVEAGEAVRAVESDGERRFHVYLPPGGWRVFAMLPAAIRGVRIAARRADGGPVTVSAEIIDEAGERLRAAVPLEITLAAEDGRTLALHAAASEGVVEKVIPVEGAVPPPRTVLVRELLSGREARAEVE
jgi:uncharacterized membrane protein